VRKILRKRLQLHQYKLQLIQKLTPNDAKQLACCQEVLGIMEWIRKCPLLIEGLLLPLGF
jgi:hypothetical protein